MANRRPNWRPKRAKLNGRCEEYLLRQGVRPGRVQGPKEVASDLGVPYPTTTGYLRYLRRAGIAHQTYAVNPFRTRFCHEYRIGVRLDGQRTADCYTRGQAREGEFGDAEGRQRYGPVERFIEEIITNVRQHPEFDAHLIIIDAAIIHGSSERDVEFHVLTDDAFYSIGRYVRNVLFVHPCVQSVTTVTVGWRYSFDGYAGQHASDQHPPAGREAEHVSVTALAPAAL